MLFQYPAKLIRNLLQLDFTWASYHRHMVTSFLFLFGCWLMLLRWFCFSEPALIVTLLLVHATNFLHKHALGFHLQLKHFQLNV